MIDKIFYNEASAEKLGWAPEWFGAYEFDEDLELDVVYLWPYTDIPSVFQRYIIAKASSRAATQLITNPNLVQLLQTQEALTRASVIEYECNQGDHSMMGFPHESTYNSYKPYKALNR